MMNQDTNKGRVIEKDGDDRKRERACGKTRYIHRQILGKIKFFDYRRGYGFLVSKDIYEDGKWYFCSNF